jgi:hypothetical protein
MLTNHKQATLKDIVHIAARPANRTAITGSVAGHLLAYTVARASSARIIEQWSNVHLRDGNGRNGHQLIGRFSDGFLYAPLMNF